MSRTWRRREMYTEVWWGNLGVTGHLEDLDVDGGLIKIGQGTEWQSVGWNFLAHDKDLWQDNVNTVMKLSGP